MRSIIWDTGQTHLFFRGIISVFLCLILTGHSLAQGVGNGRDGSPNISGVVNTYTYLTEDVNRCGDTLPVADTEGFESGDLVMIIQMQGAQIDESNSDTYGTVLDLNTTGNYEIAELVSVSENRLATKYALLRTYSAYGNTQVIRIPQYWSPTIKGTLTCPPWNGKTGGVLVLNALDTITLDANINVNGKGFRGGQHHSAQHIFDIRFDYIAESPDPLYYALKGEGIAAYGIPPFTSGRGAPANAGGGGNIHTTGGGGGSNFGCGGGGGWGYPIDTTGAEKLVFGIGGNALSYSNGDNKIFLGGGGGAGHEHFGNGTSGASGGGVIIIMAKAISGNGKTLFARGYNSASGGAYGDGVGGAGAGGTILVSTDSITSQLTIDISGGSGGSTIAHGFGPGGGGGGGLCWFSKSQIPDSISILDQGGTNGSAGGTYYGGTVGCNGGSLKDLVINQNTTSPAVHADFIILPTYYEEGNTSYINQQAIKCHNQSNGGTSTNWEFGDGTSDSAYHAIHSYSNGGIYTVTLTESNMMCSDTVTRTASTKFDLANIFTPNNDGMNDLFPENNLPEYSSVEIYDRWGRLLCIVTPESDAWDGTYEGAEVPEGTYFYVATFVNNLLYYVHKRGFVTLIR